MGKRHQDLGSRLRSSSSVCLSTFGRNAIEKGLEPTTEGEAGSVAAWLKFVFRFTDLHVDGAGHFGLEGGFDKPVLRETSNEVPFEVEPEAEVGAAVVIAPSTPFLPPPLRSKGGFKALPPKANS